MTSKNELMKGIASQFPSLSTPQSSVISDESSEESDKSTVINDQSSVMQG